MIKDCAWLALCDEMRYDAMLFELTVIEDDAKLEHLDISTYVSR